MKHNDVQVLYPDCSLLPSGARLCIDVVIEELG